MSNLMAYLNGTEGVGWSAWLGVGWVWWVAMAFTIIMIILARSPFAFCNLSLKSRVFINKVKIVCIPVSFRISVAVEILQLRRQLVIGRLKLRYLLLKRFVHKIACNGCWLCETPNR